MACTGAVSAKNAMADFTFAKLFTNRLSFGPSSLTLVTPHLFQGNS